MTHCDVTWYLLAKTSNIFFGIKVSGYITLSHRYNFISRSLKYLEGMDRISGYTGVVTWYLGAKNCFVYVFSIELHMSREQFSYQKMRENLWIRKLYKLLEY